MSERMQEAKVREAQEYLRASRRVVQLDQNDVIIHRADNGWVIQRPSASGYLTEKVYADGDEGPMESFRTALREAFPQQLEAIEQMARLDR